MALTLVTLGSLVLDPRRPDADGTGRPRGADRTSGSRSPAALGRRLTSTGRAVPVTVLAFVRVAVALWDPTLVTPLDAALVFTALRAERRDQPRAAGRARARAHRAVERALAAPERDADRGRARAVPRRAGVTRRRSSRSLSPRWSAPRSSPAVVLVRVAGGGATPRVDVPPGTIRFGILLAGGAAFVQFTQRGGVLAVALLGGSSRQVGYAALAIGIVLGADLRRPPVVHGRASTPRRTRAPHASTASVDGGEATLRRMAGARARRARPRRGPHRGVDRPWPCPSSSATELPPAQRPRSDPHSRSSCSRRSAHCYTQAAALRDRRPRRAHQRARRASSAFAVVAARRRSRLGRRRRHRRGPRRVESPRSSWSLRMLPGAAGAAVPVVSLRRGGGRARALVHMSDPGAAPCRSIVPTRDRPHSLARLPRGARGVSACRHSRSSSWIDASVDRRPWPPSLPAHRTHRRCAATAGARRRGAEPRRGNGAGTAALLHRRRLPARAPIGSTRLSRACERRCRCRRRPDAERTPADPYATASQVDDHQLVMAASLDPRHAVGFAPTCNLACRAESSGAVPFDEQYPLAAGEDRDWCGAAIGASASPSSTRPRLVGMHAPDLSFARFWRQQVRYGRGAYRFHRERPARGPASAARRSTAPCYSAGSARV